MPSITSILALGLASTAVGYLLPIPPNRRNVTVTTGSVVDHSRNGRTLMLSVFQPANCESTMPAKYMPEQTAQYQGPWLEAALDVPENLTELFLKARLPVCQSSGCSTMDDTPILLFSPGYSIPRLYYNVLASAIAGEGFTVISIDHPDDANIITYPDGHAVYNDETSQSIPTIKAHLPARLDDVKFMLDQLGNATAMARLLPHHGHRPLPIDRVAMFGHSLGGLTAVLAAAQDSRLRGAINWDATFVEYPPPSGVSQPVLLMSHGFADETWPKAWPSLKGPKLWVNIANTTHYSFSDVATLVQSAGQDTTAFAELLGTIPPARMVRILTAYTTEWMCRLFAGKIGGSLLEGQEPGRFPRATVVEKAGY